MSLSYTTQIPGEATYLQCGQYVLHPTLSVCEISLFCIFTWDITRFQKHPLYLLVDTETVEQFNILSRKCLNVVGSSIGQDIIDQFALHSFLDKDSRFGFQI